MSDERSSTAQLFQREFVGSPEPELWQKVDGYSVGVYDWAIVGQHDVEWFDDEAEARAAFDKAVGRG